MTRKLHFCSKILTKKFPLVLVERYLTLSHFLDIKRLKNDRNFILLYTILLYHIQNERLDRNLTDLAVVLVLCEPRAWLAEEEQALQTQLLEALSVSLL